MNFNTSIRKEHMKDSMCIFIYAEHYIAAKRGNLSLLMRLHRETGSVGDIRVCRKAASKGHLDIVKYMLSQGLAKDPLLMLEACTSCSIPLVQYLIDNGYKYDEEHFTYKIDNEHLEIARCLLKNGIAEKNRALYHAVAYGNLEMVKLLHSYGYRIDKGIIHSAIRDPFNEGYWECPCNAPSEKKYLKILIYLLAHNDNAHKPETYFIEAIRHRRVKIARWLALNGYPIIYTRSSDFSTMSLQHELGLTECPDKCTFCDIERIKIFRKTSYSEDGYASWLSFDIIEKLIDGLY